MGLNFRQTLSRKSIKLIGNMLKLIETRDVAEGNELVLKSSV